MIFSDSITFSSLSSTISKLQKRDSTKLEDIYDGTIYQQHIRQGRLGQLHQTSYSLAIDGVQYKIYLTI